MEPTPATIEALMKLDLALLEWMWRLKFNYECRSYWKKTRYDTKIL